MLQLKQITKSYGPKLVLDDIDLEISENEFLVLVGPSGSGKSTLMRVLAGLEEDFSGKILFKKQELTDLAPKERNLSMVFSKLCSLSPQDSF